MKKIISIVLSLLLLVSNMGFTLSTHFCDGRAVESVLTIGKEFPDCGMMDMPQQCPSHTDRKTAVGKTPCCANEYVAYDIEDDYRCTVRSVVSNDNFLFAFLYSYLSVNVSLGDHNRPHLCYASPPLVQDIPVLNQSFLL